MGWQNHTTLPNLRKRPPKVPTMYLPPQFKAKTPDDAWALVRAYPFASLISNDDSSLPFVTPLPLHLELRGEEAVLLGHCAKGNPHWRYLAARPTAVVTFMGPHAYVSPSWYPSKLENPRVVPTWNYAVVHVRGLLEVFEESDQLLSDLTSLTEKHEERVGSHWQTSDAPTDFLIRQTKGIVGIRLRILGFEAKSKLSQNRAAADQANVAATLQKSDAESDRDVAAAMARLPKA